MADHGSDYHRGEMDIQEQAATFDLFMGMTKWGSLSIVTLMSFIVPLFCTKAGFLGAAAAAVVVTVVGVLFLREKPDAGH